MSALENETTGPGFASFDYFDRTWVVPTRKNLSHIKFMRDQMQTGYGTMDLLIAETFLSSSVSPANQRPGEDGRDQFDALLDVDPDEDALDAFTSEIARVMGLGNRGNSKPSSTSS